MAIATPVSVLGDEADRVAGANVSGAQQGAISSMSGGVGDEARAEMRRAAAAYNVQVLFSGRGGAYLAGIPYTLADRAGRTVYSGVSEGPLLYLKVPPGTYRLAAELDGASQSKRIQAVASGRATRLSFVGKGE